MNADETAFDQFWQASSLDNFNLAEFAQQLNAFDSDTKQLLLEFPAKAEPLPKPNTKLNKVARARRSQRAFADKALSLKDLGLIMSSFYAWNGLEHRGFPSAGATYATEIFAIGFNVDTYSGQVMYYDAEQHGLVVVSDQAPNWQTASRQLNIETTGTPGLLVIFVAFSERALDKYGERGGRFVLLEAGAALQQLSLQLAEASTLKGVAVGGMPDNYWQGVLGLQESDARIVIGYLVGK